MEKLVYEKKVKIKVMAEEYCHKNEKENKKENNEKFNLLRGSFELSVREEIEKQLAGIKLYYSDKEKYDDFKEAKLYYIGKSLVVVDEEEKSVIEIISLLDYDSGLTGFYEFVEKFNKGYEENHVMEKEQEKRLDELANEFKNLKKNKRIEKGRILEEISDILEKNKGLGAKGVIWEELKITSSIQSNLCKRYKLFEEFKLNKMFSTEEECREIIENMPDIKLKEITYKDLKLEDREKMILDLV